jgi:LmbE family N-acetylglucosaminyl deacetylase
MKPTPNFPPEPAPLLVFGAHPDDAEFGCGGILVHEARAGRPVHLAVCSRGESASQGTPAERTAEAEAAAAQLGATLEWVELDGDARLEIRPAHARRLAEIIRRLRPAVVLAPSQVEQQHPDHHRLGRLVAEAALLARYAGLAELRALPAHAIGQLFFYAVTPEAEPAGATPVLIDISGPAVVAAWRQAMEAHATQVRSRPYIELQVARARVFGLRAGVGYAQALYPAAPLLFDSLAPLVRPARRS